LTSTRLRGGELGDGLGALGHGVLGELAREDEAHRRLDLPGRDGGLLVVARQAGGLGGDAVEDVVDEGVHDGHGLRRDAGVGVDLLEDLVDVDLVGLGLGLGALLLGVRLLGGLLGGGLLRDRERGGWRVDCASKGEKRANTTLSEPTEPPRRAPSESRRERSVRRKAPPSASSRAGRRVPGPARLDTHCTPKAPKSRSAPGAPRRGARLGLGGHGCWLDDCGR